MLPKLQLTTTSFASHLLFEHLFLEINVIAFFWCFSLIFFILLLFLLRCRLLLFFLLEIAFSHKDHLFVDSQFLIIAYYSFFVGGLVILVPVRHHLLHPADILRLFGFLLYLFLFFSGPGAGAVPVAVVGFFALDLIVDLIILVNGGVDFLILVCHSKMNIFYKCWIVIQSMKRKSSHRRRGDSDSNSSSSEYDDSSERPEELFKGLKNALVEKSGSVYRYIYKLEKNYKESVGILRIAIPDSFSFSQSDMQEFFKKFGKIQRIVLKQNVDRTRLSEDQPRNKEAQSLSYVIYSQYCSAILAMKVLNSLTEKQRIFSAKICHSHPISSEAKLFCEPLIGSQTAQDMVIEIDKDYEFGELARNFKFVGYIGLDMTDKEYKLRERILGVNGCNFIRIQYLCQKSFKFEHEHEQSKIQDLVMKLVSNKSTGLEREVLVLSNSIQKYNQAVRCLHQLLEQIIEEYKNSKEKMVQIIPKDIHIRKWEKFQVDMQLKFLT